MSQSELLWKGRGTMLGIPLFERYEIYANRVMIIRGLLSQREDEVPLHRIVDLTLDRSFVQRLLGFGTLVLRAVDVTDPVFVFRGIRQSGAIRDLLRDAIRGERERLGIEGQEMRGSAASIEHHQ